MYLLQLSHPPACSRSGMFTLLLPQQLNGIGNNTQPIGSKMQLSAIAPLTMCLQRTPQSSLHGICHTSLSEDTCTQDAYNPHREDIHFGQPCISGSDPVNASAMPDCPQPPQMLCPEKPHICKASIGKDVDIRVRIFQFHPNHSELTPAANHS